MLRLKFECNAAPGLVLGAIGSFFITDVSRFLTLGMALVMIAFAYYLGCFEVPKTVSVLANVRRELLKEIRVIS